MRAAARSGLIAAQYLYWRARLARQMSVRGLDSLLCSVASVDRRSRRAVVPARTDLVQIKQAILWGDALATRLSSLPDSCLFRALGRFALLRRFAFEPTFVMGVDRKQLVGAREIAGHAWIELDGEPFLERTGADAPLRDGVSALLETFRYPNGVTR